MVQGFLWKDLFTSDIIGYIAIVCAIIVLLRIVGIVFKNCEFLKGFVYFIKALIYGYVVLLLVLYFYVDKNAIEELNVFTGFTFLFSSIEVADNIMLFLETWCDKKLYSKDNKRILRNQEKDFEEMVSVLSSIQNSIQPGRVKKSTEQYFQEFIKNYHNMHFSQIDLILEKSETNKSFSEMLAIIAADDMTIKILRQSHKKSRKAISFDKKEYQRVYELLEKTINYTSIYYKEKRKLKNDNMRAELLRD